jgi:diguanylate cyclase (GGDEF)-like protein
LAGDPVLLGLLGAVVAVCLLFLTAAGSRHLRVFVFWTVQAGADITTSLLAGQLGRSAAGPAPRRFWKAVSRAEVLFAVGDSIKVVSALIDPRTDHESHGWQGGFFVAGCLAILWVMVTYPTRYTSAKERFRFWLDAATVLVGSAVFAWCLLIGPMLLGGEDVAHLVGSLISSGVAVLLGFAMAKLALSGDAPITAAATAPVLIAVVLQSFGDTLTASMTRSEQYNMLLVMRMLPALLVVAAPRIHQLQTGAGAPPRRRRRPYSLLPYLMVVAVFVLLCGELGPRTVNRGMLGALVGMALITALVVVRQLNAFAENVMLLERVEYQASHDPLTGLLNRTAFTDQLVAALPGQVAVVLVDLDGFKQVNDTLGHHAGDLMLVAVADRLRRSVRAGDTAARLGGDEFAMLLPGAEPAAATAVVERFLVLLDEPVDIEGQLVAPRASVGAAVGGTDPEVMLRTADAAMYRVKHGGKGTYAVVDGTPGRPLGGYPLRSAR